jgi:glycerol-3-phosphate dehydrogenase
VPGVDPRLSDRLVRRYGTEAASVVGLAAHDPALLEPFCEALPYIGAELVFAARAELAITLPDLLCRRTRAHLLDARATCDAAEHAARIVAAELGWDASRIAHEVEAYRALCTRELGTAGVLGTTEVR